MIPAGGARGGGIRGLGKRGLVMGDTAVVDGLLASRWEARDNLIPLLQEVQDRFHYLPEEVLGAISRRFKIPLTQVYHVATFYNCFSLEPRGHHQVKVCLGTACHVRGAQRILDKILRELELPTCGTTRDYAFTVEPVRCLGCCALAPIVRVDQRTYGHLQQSRIPKILQHYRSLAEVVA
jgi:NADH:ubiquinone oxidoreductase subunit E